MQERVALEGDGLGDDERRLDDLIIAVLFLLPRAKQTKVLLLITLPLGVLSGPPCDKLWVPDLRNVSLMGEGLVL